MKKFALLACAILIITAIPLIGADESIPTREDIQIEMSEKPLGQVEFIINVNEDVGANNVESNITISRQILGSTKFVELDIKDFPQHTVRFLLVFGLADITVNGKVFSDSVTEQRSGFVTLCTVRIVPECGSCG